MSSGPPFVDAPDRLQRRELHRATKLTAVATLKGDDGLYLVLSRNGRTSRVRVTNELVDELARALVLAGVREGPAPSC